ncbi:MAG: alpha/beta hydrolase [Anaerovorax sp.]
MKKETTLVWKGRGDVRLHRYFSESEITMPFEQEEKLPSVIICPGGGFYCLATDEAEIYADFFLSLGIRPFVLEYSLDEKAKFPNPLFDLGKAMVRLQENQVAWHLLPQAPYLYGISAGGFLTAGMAILGNEPILKEKFHCSEEVFRPKALILSYPLLNMAQHTTEWGENTLLPQEYGILARLQLTELVHRQMPPVLLFHNKDDQMVPVSDSLAFAQALAKNKIPCELHVFERGGHSFLQRENMKNWQAYTKAWLDKQRDL